VGAKKKALNANAEELNALMDDVADKSAGLQVMMEVLREEFKVSLAEIQDYVGMDSISFGEKVKLMMKLAKMQKSRGQTQSQRSEKEKEAKATRFNKENQEAQTKRWRK
jgi:hypothetical protein